MPESGTSPTSASGWSEFLNFEQTLPIVFKMAITITGERLSTTRCRYSNGLHMNKFLALAIALLASGTLNAADSERFITKVKLPSGQTAVVAEGDFEARSIGSFSVRLYDAASSGDETTFFRTGIVRPRDGTVEKVMLADIDGDQRPEIIVLVRSAGTGGYLSAQAFAFDKQRLIFRAVVEGLTPDAEPIATLRNSIRERN
jgi:hypothetical protein